MSVSTTSWPAKIGDFLLEELKLLLPPTIYFFCAFNLVVFTTDLLGAALLVRALAFPVRLDHGADRRKSDSGGPTAAVSRKIQERTADQAILYKTVLYSLIVAAVRFLEEVSHFLFDPRGFGAAWRSAEETFAWHHFTAVQIWLSFASCSMSA